MRRISIDTLGLMSPRGNGSIFPATKRRRAGWVSSRPRFLTTCLFFAVLYCWLRYGGKEVVIPADSFAFVEDESLKDILNTTLGVRPQSLVTL
ncbi:hypothetical protein CC80DRAFT_492622 [Byssothecium circinans]|uniref:Uncharacterized protein n=1 Tax=Byssothecium circinans TaxID=147558 RepID=A0A6A5TWG5_9PLEO|nr:hypothetical protein CC80DRAFT_492622 [Byssothecium circinans]